MLNNGSDNSWWKGTAIVVSHNFKIPALRSVATVYYKIKTACTNIGISFCFSWSKSAKRRYIIHVLSQFIESLFMLDVIKNPSFAFNLTLPFQKLKHELTTYLNSNYDVRPFLTQLRLEKPQRKLSSRTVAQYLVENSTDPQKLYVTKWFFIRSTYR